LHELLPSLNRNLNVFQNLKLGSEHIVHQLSTVDAVNTVFEAWRAHVGSLSDTASLLIGLDCEWPVTNRRGMQK
jgi:hypothetical protein